MNEQSFEIEVIFQDEATGSVLSTLKEVDVRDIEERDDHGFVEVGVVIIGTVLAHSLIKLISRLIQLWKCGVIVDARKPKLMVEKNCELPRGSVLILNADGTQATLHQVTEEQLKVKLGKLVDISI